MAATREARAIWNGDLMKGTGEVTAISSQRFDALPVSWSARTEAPGGKTSPEELLAAAHASCFAMALSAGLAKAGTPPTRLDVTSRVTFDKVGDDWTVTTSELTVNGTVPGIDQATFAKAADGAKDGCPVSRALKGNVTLSVKATLSERAEARA
jgi:lipoyl-dependent peroxiredoxin